MRLLASRCRVSRLVCEPIELLSGDWVEERADLLVVAVCLQPIEDPNVYDAHRVVAAREVEALDKSAVL